jgi:gliding motility-associated lipoprotein GldH
MHQLQRSVLFLLLLSASVSITGCDPRRIYEKNEKIPSYNWEQNNSLSFLVDIHDTVSYYTIFLNVRNAGYYRFSNLFLFINTRLPQGQIQRDTVECVLASPDGKWLGDGLGDIYDNRILFKEHVRFPQIGEYRFDLIQAMRVNPLPGIMDAGIRIEKEKK